MWCKAVKSYLSKEVNSQSGTELRLLSFWFPVLTSIHYFKHFFTLESGKSPYQILKYFLNGPSEKVEQAMGNYDHADEP
jgi:hypothetical protein